MQTMLSDGSQAVGVHLSATPVMRGCASTGNAIWVLSKGSNVITVRNARSGEVITKVDILDEGVAIATVGSRVWVATVSNKIFVFGFDGTLLGALQASGLPTVRQFFVLSDNCLFTGSGGKDFSKWDTNQFTVERTFFGSLPGELITCVTQSNNEFVSFVASSTQSIRMWTLDGTCVAEVQEGATSVVAVTDGETNFVWAAQAGWITIFSFTNATKSTYFQREKTLPCAGVKQLLRTTKESICSLDNEGLVTLWAVASQAPVRSFKTTSIIGAGSGPASFCVRAMETTTSIIWTIGDGRAMIWQDECSNSEGVGHDHTKDLQKDEISFLRRKMKYLESVGTVYRQKIGLVFREKSASPRSGSTSTSNQTAQTFNELDQAYAKALETWDSDNRELEPIPDGRATVGPSGDYTEYWKQKYHDTLSELSKLQKDHENLSQMLHENDENSSASELDIKRAHHICQLIKEKNEFKERERQLTEDVSKLRSKLREFNTPLASRGPVEDVEELKSQNRELRDEIVRLKAKIDTDSTQVAETQHAVKHNQILKQRVKKLRTDLDEAQIQLSENTAIMQRDMDNVLQTVSNLQTELDETRRKSSSAERAKAEAELQVVQRQALVDKYRAIAEAADRELQERDAVEKAANAEVRSEISMLCQSLDDRDTRIGELQRSYNGIVTDLKEQTAQSREAKAVLDAKQLEMESMTQRLKQLEGVVHDRKNYARVIGELQGRMEMVVEELRRSFTPVQFAQGIDNLENRVASLFSLEEQLKHKDDIIALKDDKIQQLQEHCGKVEEQINSVSTVFLHLPKSIDEVELLMIEVDEYRRRLGMDPETQEMIQIRLLELQAKRRAGEKIPANLDLTPSQTPGKSAGDVQRLKEINDAAKSLAVTLMRDDKTGLIRTPAATTVQHEPTGTMPEADNDL